MKKTQEINESYLKTITKINSESNKQVIEMTNINNYLFQRKPKYQIFLMKLILKLKI